VWGARQVELIKRGGFEGLDAAMMVHPSPGYTLWETPSPPTHTSAICTFSAICCLSQLGALLSEAY
jgi:hypothetical protein